MKLNKNSKILIVGLGLIGGSYAKALTKKGTYLRGGMPSGHATIAATAVMIIWYLTQVHPRSDRWSDEDSEQIRDPAKGTNRKKVSALLFVLRQI